LHSADEFDALRASSEAVRAPDVVVRFGVPKPCKTASQVG
jgi:hypothetical protein